MDAVVVDPFERHERELDRRTGEFRSGPVERAYRLHELAESGDRLSRFGLWIAVVFLGFSLTDLSDLGATTEWLVLLVARATSAAFVAWISIGFRRDPARYVDGAGSRMLVLGQTAVIIAFLSVCAVRPGDVITHVVTAIMTMLIMGFFVPGSVRTKLTLIVGFQLAFVGVAITSFGEATMSIGALVANFATATVFTFTVVTNLNRAQRTEWRVNLEQREVNARLVEEVRSGERLRAELHRQATEDDLTGLANRRSFLTRGEELVELARRHGSTVTAVLMDADGFKQINDLYGHAAGDAVLRAVGDSLQASSRRGELIGRIGGEEFAVVAEGLDDDGAAALAERMREAVRSTSVLVDGFTLGVTVSVGFTGVAPTESLASALGRADRAMYAAKASGGDRVLLGAA